MLIIPALDIKDGHCVRLKQGKMRDATVFSEDPVGMAQHWKAEGARRLHLVDLNGAAAGKPKNEGVIRAILQALGDSPPVQLGGGIRDLDTIEHYLGRDGMLTGVNVDATLKLARELRVPVIASGGLTSVEDIKALCKIESEGIDGVITGRAIYQGTLDFKKAQAEADKLGKGKGKTQ